MLKKFILIGLCLMALPTVAQNAARCEGGSLITGANNHEYCLSDITMNWWSAHSWCRAQGRTLVTVTQACNGIFPNMNASCDNFAGRLRHLTEHAWTTTPYRTDSAYTLNLYQQVQYRKRNATSLYALCF